MRNGRQPHTFALAALTAAALALASGTGCGGDDDAGDGSADRVADDQAEGGRGGGDGGGDGDSQGDTCDLLDDAALAPLFPDGVPDPSGTSMGEGFAECEWGRESEGTVVLLSTLPAADFRSDYVDQLDVTAPVAGVGDGGVSFPGFVGIGRGSAGGGSVGFTKGDRAVLVAVRTGDGPSDDAGRATDLVTTIAERL